MRSLRRDLADMMAYELIYHVRKGQNGAKVGDLSGDETVSAYKPILVGENWNGLPVDWLLKPLKVLDMSPEEREESFFKIFTDVMEDDRIFADPDKVVHETFKESERASQLLVSIEARSPQHRQQIQSETFLSILWVLSEKAIHEGDKIIFEFDTYDFELKGNRLEMVGADMGMTLAELDWVKHMTSPRKSQIQIPFVIHGITALPRRIGWRNEPGIIRLVDILVHFADHKYMEKLLYRNIQERWRPHKHVNIPKVFVSENIIEAVENILHKSDLDETQFLETYADFKPYASEWTFTDKLEFLNSLTHIVDYDKGAEYCDYSFFGQSWKW